MSDLFHTKWFWGMLCLVLGCTLSFQMGQQSAIARNNASTNQLDQVLSRLDAANRQKLTQPSAGPASSDRASVFED